MLFDGVLIVFFQSRKGAVREQKTLASNMTGQTSDAGECGRSLHDTAQGDIMLCSEAISHHTGYGNPDM